MEGVLVLMDEDSMESSGGESITLPRLPRLPMLCTGVILVRIRAFLPVGVVLLDSTCDDDDVVDVDVAALLP